MKLLPPLIFEQTVLQAVPPKVLDAYWSRGWRHFGVEFFRYSVSFDETGQKVIQPLRLNLRKFHLTKSLRRVLNRNADLRVVWTEASLHPGVCDMFQRHKTRFVTNVPEDLGEFLGRPPGLVTACHELQVWLGETLVAASFFEASDTSASGVYGIFEPEYAERSLGTFTMLQEVLWAQERGLAYYYSGYATREPSHYDYKKRFAGLEIYDWRQRAWVEPGAEEGS
jgi:leucyl-tRNA---protein transferase